MQYAAKSKQPAKCRIFCFPFAGGSEQLFFAWRNALPENFDLVPIHYPGRGRKFCDPLIDNAGEMVEYIWEQIHALLDRPYVFLGYSLGGMLSLEVARKAHALGFSHQLLHIICAYTCNSIAAQPRAQCRYQLSDSELKDYVLQLGGVSSADLNDEMWEFYLPVLRADFKILDTAKPSSRAPIGTSAKIFYGAEDTLVTKKSAAQWSSCFAGHIEVDQLPGGHFFINEGNRLLNDVGDCLAKLLQTDSHLA